jgi:hypothetical protein
MSRWREDSTPFYRVDLANPIGRLGERLLKR